MNNAEQPIYPVKDIAEKSDKTQSGFIYNDYNGLTKREYAAIMAMSGIMANNRAVPTIGSHFENIAEDSIRIADELLKQLENNTNDKV